MRNKLILRRKVLGLFLTFLGGFFGILFFMNIHFPLVLQDYFKQGYYQQFGPIAICVELLIAGSYLFRGHLKTNFLLTLFAFTALLDPFFNLTGLFSSLVPLYATLIFVMCAIVCLPLLSATILKLAKCRW